MSKLARKTFIQFGTTVNTASEIGQFGGYATLDFSGDVGVMQSGTAWNRGWFAETINTNRPFIQDMNAIDYVYSYFLCYLLQEGLAEYDAGTTYYTNSRCQYSGVSYISLQDNNTGNTPGSASSLYWQAIGDVLGANIVSASSIQPGSDGTIFQVTGTTTITSILNPNSIKRLTLIFTGALTVTSNSNIALNNGNFVTAAGSVLTLAWNGSNWVEVSRSPVPNPLTTGSLTSNGWTKFPNGLILQWGQNTTTGGQYTTISLPIPFPNSFLVGSVNFVEGNAPGGSSLGIAPSGNSAIVIQNTVGSTQNGIYWTAIGY